MRQKQPPAWRRLDNAAKIFPPTSSRRDPKVFRFGCELFEPVRPALLQTALDRTLDQFPFYRSVLKKGLFWYYLEDSDRTLSVHKENRPPCSALYLADKKSLLLDLSYFGRRINLELYHALADGAGALRFFRTLISRYLLLAHEEELHGIDLNLDTGSPEEELSADSFSRYFEREKKQLFSHEPHAYRIRGEQMPLGSLGVIEARIPVGLLLDAAHRYGATLTEFLTAVLLCAIHGGMSARERRRPVVIAIPVNLRAYFPSESARNFFEIVNIGHRFPVDGETLEAVVAHVKAAFSEKLTPERLRRRMNQLSALEHTLLMRLVPLAYKDPVLRLFNWLGEREITAAFSNIGKIQMPPELTSYIRLFDAFVSTPRIQICSCSFGDEFVLTFTSAFLTTDIQRRFFRTLSSLGLPVELSTNLYSDEKEVSADAPL